MNKKLSLIFITALLATNSVLPISAIFSRAFTTIKEYPVAFATVGLAAATWCNYKSNKNQQESDWIEGWVTNLTHADRDLINDNIHTPLNNNQPINLSSKFYDKIVTDDDQSRMEIRTRDKLKNFIELYNEQLQHAPNSEGFHFYKDVLTKIIMLLNNRNLAINRRDTLERYASRYHKLSYLCSALSLVSLAILAKKYW